MTIEIRIVPHGSAEYEGAKAVRQEVLRTPLGLILTEKDTEGEETQLHIVGMQSGKVIGTVSLKPLEGHVMKLRQMAVSSAVQGQGVGASLVRAAEKRTREDGFESIECHARISALPFYEKLGYTAIGHPFTEVGQPHIKMIKPLTE